MFSHRTVLICGSSMCVKYYLIYRIYFYSWEEHFSIYSSTKQLRVCIHTIGAKPSLPMKIHIKEVTVYSVSDFKMAGTQTLLACALCESEALEDKSGAILLTLTHTHTQSSP